MKIIEIIIKHNDENKSFGGFFNRLRSAVDDIGENIAKRRNSIALKPKELEKEKEKINYQKKLQLSQDLISKLSSSHFKQTVVFLSCISTIHKVIKRLEVFTSKIDLDFQKFQIIDQLNLYKTIIKQIQYFFYMKISKEILYNKYEKISIFIENFDWEPVPEEGQHQLFEASQWVEQILLNYEVIIENINEKYFEIFGKKKLGEFFTIITKFVLGNVMDSFIKIKKCNNIGRSVMLKDMKFIKQGVERILGKFGYGMKIVDTNQLFDIPFQFVNAWYYSKEELEKFVFDNNIQYRYYKNIFLSSPIINRLSNEEKNDFNKKMESKYGQKFHKIVNSFYE